MSLRHFVRRFGFIHSSPLQFTINSLKFLNIPQLKFFKSFKHPLNIKEHLILPYKYLAFWRNMSSALLALFQWFWDISPLISSSFINPLWNSKTWKITRQSRPQNGKTTPSWRENAVKGVETSKHHDCLLFSATPIKKQPFQSTAFWILVT